MATDVAGVRRFRLAQVASRPQWLPEIGLYGYDVRIEHVPLPARALVEPQWLTRADEELRRWIVRQLNLLSERTSYGTACLELHHGFRVPPPPAV